MPQEFSRCQYVSNGIECETWYKYDGIKLCEFHRNLNSNSNGGDVHIPRTVTVIPQESIEILNQKVAEFSTFSIPDLIQHIHAIEDQIKVLERDRRAANMAKRTLEDKLTDEERIALREEGSRYKVQPERQKKAKINPEEKAKSRKEGFSAWAARLGVNVSELMVMDDDEMAARIAKYKKSKG